MPGSFQVGISAVIERDDGRILLLHRAPTKDFGAGEWEPITGRLEPGESIDGAARREVLEESGLAVAALVPYATFHFRRLDVDLVGVAFACQCGPGVPKISDEHDAQRWVTASELAQMELHQRVRDSLDFYWRWRPHFGRALPR